MGVQYVDDFQFPSEAGFTASAGSTPVKGYMRGGHVKSATKSPTERDLKASRMKGTGDKAEGTTAAMKGGMMKKGKGGYANPGPLPPNVKAKGGRAMKKGMKGKKEMSMHDKLMHEGKKMGYATGGQVKDTSGEFMMSSGAQDDMDSATFTPGHEGNELDKKYGPKQKTRPRAKGGMTKKARGKHKQEAHALQKLQFDGGR